MMNERTRQPLVVPTDRDASGRSFGIEELTFVRQVLESGSLNSNSGLFVRRFEREFAAQVGAAYCVACSSGSFAVQAALFACQLPRGSRVATTPITDFGAITALLYEGMEPAFCDVDPLTLMPTAQSLAPLVEQGVGAVVCTHLFGRPAEAKAIRTLCDEHETPLIEDAAQALGAVHEGRAAGRYGQLATFSFQQGKHLCAGEGGAVVTDSPELARLVRLFVNKAWPYGEPDPDHLFVAPNGRMTELQAAVLVAQLAKLDGFVASRRASAAALLAEVDGLAELSFPALPPGDRHSFWRVALRVPRGAPVDLDALARALREDGIPAQARYVGRPAFALKALVDAGFERDPKDYPGVERGLAECLVLAWNERIGVELACTIGQRLRASVNRLRGRSS